jgi:ABC-type sugar transport system ATPase subunit
VLELRDVVRHHRLCAARSIFTVGRNEIVGLAGLEGQGQIEHHPRRSSRAMHPETGEILFEGLPLRPCRAGGRRRRQGSA